MPWLKALVIGMGVLIVAGFTLVVVTIASRIGGGRGEPGFGTLALDLAESCRIAASTLDGERLVLHLQGPAKDGCADVIVVDLESGRVLGRIEPGPGPAR